MRILVTGATGLLGAAVATQLSTRGEVIGLSRNPDSAAHLPFSTQRIDLLDEAALQAFLQRQAPDCIVNCSAATHVDGCEENQEPAVQLNVRLPEALAQWTQTHNATFVHISTDSVFNGEKSHYAESAPTAPLNVYGQTKALAEQRVLDLNPSALVVRTNFFGWNLQNKLGLAEWLLQALLSGQHIHAFQDVTFNALYTRDLALILQQLIELKVQGLLHVGASSHCSKYAFARKVAAHFNLDSDLIHPTAVAQKQFKARRPRNTVLSIDRLRCHVETVPTVESGLCRFQADLQDGWLESWRGQLPDWLAAFKGSLV